MNTRIVARGRAREAPHSLSERIARFANAINGSSAPAASKSYWEQGKRVLTSGPDMDPKEAVFEAAPESEGWDLVLPWRLGHGGKSQPVA